VVNAPDAGAALQQLVQDAGPGLGSLVRNLDILNGVTIPRLDGVEQMLVTYPDVVSGGFTVVRRDADGQMRSHFGFVLNSGDPRACTSVTCRPPRHRAGARWRAWTPTGCPAA
jgi:ABC-type transporter Mla subunit MlaD